MPIISGNVPEHLVIGARSGFLSAISNPTLPWRQVAGVINMTSKSLELVDLGGAPMPVEDFDGGPIRQIVEKSIIAKARNWNVTVGVSYNAVQDDQTGNLEPKVKAAGENFDAHMNKLIFSALNAGDGTTYGSCYDGLEMFDASHIDKGAHYQTAQSNLPALALSLDNFTTVLVAAQNFVDDQGNYTSHNYDTLIVPPAYNYLATQITGNARAYDTANQEMNPYAGMKPPIVSPWLDSTAWILAATSGTQKPIYLCNREAPALQSAWFDPLGPDGGVYYFKFYSRYTVVYGDWRLATLGHS
jgi:phage major head subunit gpT-like protein